MQFYNATDKELSIYHDTLFILGISGSNTTTFPVDPDYTRSVNEWVRKVVLKIWRNAADWSFDDANLGASATDGIWTYAATAGLPTATATLVDTQQEYAIPTTALAIEAVEVLSSDGTYKRLRSLDKSQITGSITEHFKQDGLPGWYDLEGAVIRLYPAPAAASVTLAAGLKIFVSRDIDEFTPADTTQEPPFREEFHRIVSYGCALDYATRKNMVEKIDVCTVRIGEMMQELEEYYSRRNERGFKQMIRPKRRLRI